MNDDVRFGASRRAFLRAAAAGSATLVLPSPAALHVGGDETLKVALIGCGSRGTGAVAQALSTDGPVKLWAMADAFGDRLEASLKNLTAATPGGDRPRRSSTQADANIADRVDVPPERRFVGLDAYRRAIDSGADVVILTGPPGFRPQHFEYAVAAGKHAFMEKPVATDGPGVRRVLAAAEEAKRKNLKVGVGLQRRHQLSYQQAIGRLHDGATGDVIALRCYWNGGPPAKTPVPKGSRSEFEHQVRNWYFFTWLSGDHIVEQHIHNLDVGNWVKNGHPVEAQGQGGRQVRTGKEYGQIFDHHAVEFTYADGSKMFSQCRQIPGCWNRVAEYAHGTKGIVEFGVNAVIRTGNEVAWRSKRGEGGNPYQVEHDVLFDAIRSDKPHNEAEQGAIGTLTAVLGRMATYSGQVVTWDQAMNSPLVLTTDAETWDAEPPVRPDAAGHYPVATPGVTRAV